MVDKQYDPNEYRKELENKIARVTLEANSHYNDGWTREGFNATKEALEKKLKKVGKQLKFNFT
jgi:glutathionyl-hydroquinone reductase